MVGLGGALAGGSRIALTRGVDPSRFADEVHRYGVTVVAYTWAMLRELVDVARPNFRSITRSGFSSGRYADRAVA